MPQIKIVSPVGGQIILGDRVNISFIVSDFSVGQDGYINLWLDNPIQEASTAAKIASQFDYTLSDVPSGPHILTLEAIKSNHLSFNPPAVQTVSFSTALPQESFVTLSPAPKSIFTFASFISWQHILIITAVLMTIIGFVVKFTFGKPIREE